MLVLVEEECQNESEFRERGRSEQSRVTVELNGCRARQVIAGRKPETRGGEEEGGGGGREGEMGGMSIYFLNLVISKRRELEIS